MMLILLYFNFEAAITIISMMDENQLIHRLARRQAYLPLAHGKNHQA